jgi:hypothetical protein
MHESQHHPAVIVDMTMNLVPSLDEALSSPTELTLLLAGFKQVLCQQLTPTSFFLINELTSAHAHNTTPTHMDGTESEYWGVREREG